MKIIESIKLFSDALKSVLDSLKALVVTFFWLFAIIALYPVLFDFANNAEIRSQPFSWGPIKVSPDTTDSETEVADSAPAFEQSAEKVIADQQALLSTIQQELNDLRKTRTVVSPNASGSKPQEAPITKPSSEVPSAANWTSGWAYLGTFRGGSWSDELFEAERSKLPNETDALTNMVLVAKTDINLRDRRSEFSRASGWQKGNIIGVINKSERVKISEVDTKTPALGGGLRIWIKVSPKIDEKA